MLLDLYDCKPGACDDLGLCYNFLEEIVGVLKVAPQSPPFIFRTDGKRYPHEAALRGWMPLGEGGIMPRSHAAARRSFPVKAFVKSFFAPKHMDEQFVERGLDYNK